MKKIFLLFLILILNGCLTVTTYTGTHYIDKSPLNDIPFNKDSTLSVIYFDRIPVAGDIKPISYIQLGYYDGNTFQQIITSQFKTRLVNNRLYIFNLPPHEYFVTAVYPLPRGSVPGDSKEDTVYISVNTNIVFNESSYSKYPLTVKPLEFNLLGNFAAKRSGLFTKDGVLERNGDMAKDLEKQEFIKNFGNNNPWVDIIDSNV